MTEQEPARVNFVIPDTKREKWDEYWQNQPELSNRTDLIVTAVEREIAGRNGDTGGTNDEIALQVADMADKMDELLDQVGNVERRLTTIEDESRTSDDIARISSDVYGVLPDKRPGSPAWEEQMESILGGPDDDSKATGVLQWKGSVEAIAELLDVPRYKVRAAVEELLEKTPSVREVEYDGESRYYKNQ